jgi:hypothetical protein
MPTPPYFPVRDQAARGLLVERIGGQRVDEAVLHEAEDLIEHLRAIMAAAAGEEESAERQGKRERAREGDGTESRHGGAWVRDRRGRARPRSTNEYGAADAKFRPPRRIPFGRSGRVLGARCEDLLPRHLRAVPESLLGHLHAGRHDADHVRLTVDLEFTLDRLVELRRHRRDSGKKGRGKLVMPADQAMRLART